MLTNSWISPIVSPFEPTLTSSVKTINLDFERQTPAEFFQGLNFSVGSSDSPSSFTVTTTRDTTQNPSSSGNTFTYAVGVQGVTIQKDIVQSASENEIFINDVINLGIGMTVTGYNIGSGVTIIGVNTAGTPFISVSQNVTTTTAYPQLNITGNKYFIFDQQQPLLTFVQGNTYIINYPAAHPVKFSQTENGTHNGGSEYTGGVSNPTSTSVQIVVSGSTPATLYYYCQNHSAMGGQINVTA